MVDEQFARQYLGPGDPLSRRLRLARSNEWIPIVGVAGTSSPGRSKPGPAADRSAAVRHITPFHVGAGTHRRGPADGTDGDSRAIARGLDKISAVQCRADDDAHQQHDQSLTVGRVRVDSVRERGAGAGCHRTGRHRGVFHYAKNTGVGHPIGARRPTTCVGRRSATYGGCLTLVGLVLGLAGGLATAHVFTTLIPGTQVLTPALLGTTALALVGVGAAASYLPARRILSIDLVTILKRE